jgi:hypothetical protein
MHEQQNGRQRGRSPVDAELVEVELVRAARALVVEHWQDGITARAVHELEDALEQLHIFERQEGA